MFQANPYGIMGLLTIAMCWAFAVVLYRVGAPDSVARKLAVLLVIEGFIYLHGISLIVRGLTDAPEPDFFNIVYAGDTFLAVPLIAYGILRTQLFDIDLRIRWTIKQSTVAAVFVAVFYLVSEGADRLFESEFGDIAGLLASALVVFFLVPLQRFVERVAGAAMPNTENTPEYTMFRKLQVYEAAWPI
jgi:hypothetical protein